MYPMHSVPLRGQSRTQPTRFPVLARTRAAHVVLGLARALARRWQARRDQLHLSEMDDHLLADIGVARADIRVVIGDPRWMPTTR